MTIEDNLFTIKTQIQNAYTNSTLLSKVPQLLAVSKKHSTESINKLNQLGIMDFAENYAQELADKAYQLQDKEIQWHFLGPIQSNKTKVIAENAHWVQSIDRSKIAQRLNKHCNELGKTLDVLVQVNISKEEQKAGVMVAALPELLSQVYELPQLKLRGLMCIPSKSGATQEFQAMKRLYDIYCQQYSGFDTLSMGMSADYLEAIAQGATMVRIGSALFGERP